MLALYFIFCILSAVSDGVTGLSKHFDVSSEFTTPSSSAFTIEDTEMAVRPSQYTTSEFSSIEELSTRKHIKYGSKMEFFGKVVLITGANSGIGKRIARYFAKLGATLSMTGKDFRKLYSSYKEIRPFATVKPHIPCGELGNSFQAAFVVQYTMNRFNRIDVLVNCAGSLEFGSIKNTSGDQLDRIFNNNVKSAYLITKEAVPHLEKTKGTIINVSSLAGLRPFPGMLAYCMSKAAIDQFTKCLALELGPSGIRVNSVNPSVVASGLHLRAGMNETMYRKYLNDSVAKHVLGRIASMTDVARAVAFLASSKASFITGVNFPIDGGRSHMCP